MLIKHSLDGELAYSIGGEFVGRCICKGAGKSVEFETDDIVYAQANDKYVDVHLSNGKTVLMMTPLNKIAEVFGESFVLLSRKTLVRRSLIASWSAMRRS